MGKRMIFCLMSSLVVTMGMAKTINAKVGQWKVSYDISAHVFQFDHNGQTVIKASNPEATYKMGGIAREVNAANFRKAQTLKNDNGRTFRFTQSTTGDPVAMEMVLESCGDELLARLVLVSDVEISSNYLAPICTVEPQMVEGNVCRMMKVPYDNDDFVRYYYNPLDREMLSYEVSAIFDGESRKGIVIGSVEHDHWKSGVEIKASNGYTIDRLKAYSGVSTKETRDIIPHGALVGKRVAGAKFLLCAAKDWRDGMERFATICNEIAPGRRSATLTGTPFGWQSWGVMSSHNNFNVDMAVADYYANDLRAGGFAAEDGLQIMSIDAWDNLNREQKRQLTIHCEEQGQIAGLYRSPFCLWWGQDADLNNPIYKGCEYKAIDCVLKADGKPIRYDGAFSLDPTHPGTKAMMKRDMEEARRQGFRYVKVDFVCNGMIQADSYYNPEVHTAVEAYNEGMAYFNGQCVDKDGQPMFIALSIAPIFPYQYGNSRRIACDTWGKISQSEYAMNAIGGGWWTNLLYQRNDPDHIVLVGNDAEKETEGENRARLTTGIASGMILLADNYDINDTLTHCGDAKLSRERAQKLLMNKDINALARSVKLSFRPIYGYRSWNGDGGAAETMVMQTIGDGTYVAIINYKDETFEGAISLKDLGLDADHYKVQELWTHVLGDADQKLNYSIPGKDARIFKLTK